MDSVLVFDIFGDYGQFKKFFTNMSPLTFDLPSRTALMGLIGAIGGISKDKNPEFFAKDKCFVSLRIINSLRKTKIPINYLKTVSKTEISKFKNHKPTNIEFLKNPKYRIYFYHNDKSFFNYLFRNIREHKAVYTTSLGIANCLADFEYVGMYDIEKKQIFGFIDIDSVVLEENVEDIGLKADVKIKRTTLPLEMKNNREVTNYGNVFYETSGKKMTLKIKECYYLKESQEYICEF